MKQLEDALLVRDSLIADLQAAKKIDDKIGGHEEQKKVLDEYQGEFPELVEDIKPFLENMIRKGIEKEQSAKAELDDKNAWLKAQDDFFSANQVFKSSPILYDMLDSAVKTVAADDASNNFTYQEVLDKAKEMVQAAIGKLHGVETPKKPDIADVKKKAEDIIAKVEEKTPFSLSDVPGSTAAHHDEAEALANMSALATMDKFMSKSPDKIEELLSRLV